jgi:tetratricopeptide (TPR) repeat protein
MVRMMGVALASASCAGVLWMGGCKARERRVAMVEPGPNRLGEAIELSQEAERLMKAGKRPEAIAKYRQAIEASPELPAAWHNLGVLMMEEDNHVDAVQYFKAAADLSPGDPRPYYMIGKVYDIQGWSADSLRYFVLALERQPNYVPALRGAVRAGKRLDLADRAALERAKRALMVESDETWRQIAQREALRIEGSMKQAQAASRIELGGPVGAQSAPSAEQP